MYAMCTGRPPFRSETSYGTLRRICEDQPRPIREINPAIPEWLEAFIGHLHAKQSSDRFETARETAALLEECLVHVQQPTASPLPAAVTNLIPVETPAPQMRRTAGFFDTPHCQCGAPLHWSAKGSGFRVPGFRSGQWLRFTVAIVILILISIGLVRLLSPSRQAEVPPIDTVSDKAQPAVNQRSATIAVVERRQHGP